MQSLQQGDCGLVALRCFNGGLPLALRVSFSQNGKYLSKLLWQ